MTEGLSFLFNDTRALSTSAEFIDLVMFDWSPTSFTGGGPNTIMTPGMLTGPDCPARVMNDPWLGKVFFASSENAKNVAPVSTSPTYDPSAPENLPRYDASGNLLSSSTPPFRSRYSDMRQGLGYIDGAIVSGKYVASQVAESLASTPAASAAMPPAATPPAAAPPAPAAAGSTPPAGDAPPFDPSALDPSAALPPISAADTLAILSDIATAIARREQGRTSGPGWRRAGRPMPRRFRTG